MCGFNELEGVDFRCPLFRGKNIRLNAVQRKDFVRCPESGSVHFSEVANVLQLWHFQSVTLQVSVVAWVSASWRVRYGGSTVVLPCNQTPFPHYIMHVWFHVTMNSIQRMGAHAGQHLQGATTKYQ